MQTKSLIVTNITQTKMPRSSIKIQGMNYNLQASKINRAIGVMDHLIPIPQHYYLHPPLHLAALGGSRGKGVLLSVK